MALWQAREEGFGVQKLLMVGAIQANHDFLQIGHLCQRIDDLVQRGALQLGIE
ncbi:hypothetical protein D3C75_1247580 [compost metagenome]